MVDLDPGTIILDQGDIRPKLWVVKSKTKLVAVLDDGSVLHADFKGKLWKGASTVNNQQLAHDLKLRYGSGIRIGSEWTADGPFRLKVVDLRRDGRVILEVLERPKGHGWVEGMEVTKTPEELREQYELVESTP